MELSVVLKILQTFHSFSNGTQEWLIQKCIDSSVEIPFDVQMKIKKTILCNESGELSDEAQHVIISGFTDDDRKPIKPYRSPIKQ